MERDQSHQRKQEREQVEAGRHPAGCLRMAGVYRKYQSGKDRSPPGQWQLAAEKID